MRNEKTNTIHQDSRWLLSVVMMAMIAHLLLTAFPALAGGEPQAEQPAPVILTDEQGEYPLGLYLEILQDPGGELTFDDVASPEYDGQFTPSQEQIPNLGYTDSAIWVRFQARSEALQTGEWRLELGFANMQHVYLYIPLAKAQPSSGQGFQVKEAGTLYPFADRDIPYHLFVFKLSLAPGAEQTFYLRFENQAAMTLPLTLWSVEAFARHSQSETLIAGLLYGILLIMLGYNLFLWLTLHEKDYLHYVLFVGAGTMFQLSISGFSGQYLWPNLPRLNLYAVPFWCMWAVFFSLTFGAAFLTTKARALRQHRVILLLLALWGLVLVQTPFVAYRFIVQQENVLVIVSFVWLIIMGFAAWRRDYQVARYYLLAWMALLGMLVVVVLVRMSMLPSTPLTEHGYEVGVVFLVLFMSLALADQISSIKQERIEAQAHALESLREKEALIRKQNVMLETRVAERTAELRELNATLETKVAARTGEILAEKEKNEAILHSVGDAIMMLDRERRIQYINPAFTTMTGYTAEEALGRHPSSVGAAAGSEQVQSSIESALAEGRKWQGEVPSQRKDGRNYHAALIVSPLRDAEGNLMGYVSSHRDISQRKDLERARNQFQDNVSHQFRTPVTTLQLYVYLMQQAELPEKTRDYLRTMGEEITWLIHLIQDILEMTALDSGKAIATWQPVSLSVIIENTLIRYRSQAETSGLTLTALPLPPELPAVEGDQTRLAQALGEILENAIVFTPSGGQVTLRVETAEDEGHTWVVVAVQDTGPGIPPEEQEKVFNRFFRGTIAESGHTLGVGLGLSIAQEILRAHGGRVTVESGESGSTFRLWLRAGSG